MKRALKQDDVVVTPMGRRAQVQVRDEEGFCELLYIDQAGDMTPTARQVTVHERLLVLAQRGRELPPPVRVRG